MRGWRRVLFASSGLLACAGLLLVLGVHAGGMPGNAVPRDVSAGDDETRPLGGSSTAVGEISLAELEDTALSLATADLDRDGAPDVVCDGLLAWANPYTAPFAAPWVTTRLAERPDVEDLAVGDLDNDGDVDIVAGGRFGLAIWQNPLSQGASTPFGTWLLAR